MAFPLIFKIANETLADIFLLNTNVVERWDTRTLKNLIIDHDPRLTTRYSSQVCQRWRDVALGYPTIWSRIVRYDKDPLPWVEELLQRSQPTTLELGQAHQHGRLGIRSPQLPVLSRAMCHAQRLKTVNICVEQAAWQGICEGILQIRAPNLEYFQLIISDSFITEDSKGTLVFTGSLFSDDAPCLRRLHLCGCLVNFSSSILLNITELSLEDIPSGAPTVHAWLTILGNMPFLRWLTIVEAISGLFPTCPLPTPHLPSLSCLSIEGNFPECTALVDHIICPPLGMLRLKCIDAAPGPSLKRLSFMIEKRLSFWRTPAKADRDFVFKCLKGNEILITNSNRFCSLWDVNESGFYHASQDPVLSIELFFADAREMESSVLSFLLAFSHILTTVSRLTFWLDATTEHMFNRLLEVFHLFNSVEEISLLRNSPIVILPFLQTPQPIGEDAPPMDYLPSLRKLTLRAIDFNHSQGLAFDVLVSYLQYRRQVLAPIETVRILFSSIDRARLEIFKQLTGVNLDMDSNTT